MRPPLSAPAGLGHLEVPQAALIDHHPVLLFCTNSTPPGHTRASSRIWVATGPSLTGPWDIAGAHPLHHPHLYAPRLVRDLDGSWAMIGFIDQVDGVFMGELTDPIPVQYRPGIGLVTHAAPSAR